MAKTSNQGYAVIDLETTGLNKKGDDRIVEIAIILLDHKGQITNFYSTLVNPKRKIGGVKIHGISEGMLKKAPTFKQIAPVVASLLNGRKIVAHNSKFDAMMLKQELVESKIFVNESNFIDTLSLSRATLKLKRYSLESVAKHYKLKFEDQHTALSDALMCAQIFNKLRRRKPQIFLAYKARANMFKYDKAVNVLGYNNRHYFELWDDRLDNVEVQTFYPYKTFRLFHILKYVWGQLLDGRKPKILLYSMFLLLSSAVTLQFFAASNASWYSLAVLPIFFIFMLYLEHRVKERRRKRRHPGWEREAYLVSVPALKPLNSDSSSK